MGTVYRDNLVVHLSRYVSCIYVYMHLNKVLLSLLLLLVGWGVDQYVGGLSVDILA